MGLLSVTEEGGRMIKGLKVTVIMPAYKAEHTIKKTYDAIPHEIVDNVILVDDASDDNTVATAEELGIDLYIHDRNLGYGANQKTCYREALKSGTDIVVMLHPDYQYDPKLVTAMAAMLSSGIYDVVLASRIIGGSPLRGGMPMYKYFSNRILTLFQNIIMGTKISEFHTGYRAFTRKVLEKLPLLVNSDDFVFDNQMLAQTVAFNFRIGEISCPTKYFPEASSINFYRSIIYGIGVIKTSIQYRLWKWKFTKSTLFNDSGTYKLSIDYYKPHKPIEKAE
jgi:glycosyltransferase involved in cell wall biosynthesis